MSNLNDHAKKSLGFIHEFKEFCMRGNVVDLAVGVIIGGAFGKIVTSMVSDVLMPIIGVFTPGGNDLKNKFISLQPEKTQGITDLAAAQKAGAVVAYGQFISAIIDFVIVAFCIFLVIKLMTKLRPPPPPATPETPPQEKLLAEIRDILKSKP